MNNLIKNKFSIALILAITIFASCKQENISIEPSEEKVLTFQENLDPLDELIRADKDEKVQFINKENVNLCKVLMEIVTEKDVNKFLVETAQKNNGEITYEMLFEKFPSIKLLFSNTIIAKRTSSSNLDIRGDQSYDYVHNGVAYKSVIFVPNHTVARASDKSITCPEIQIYRETGKGDIYFAWDVQKDKPKKEINIVEREAMSTTVPMFVTSLQHVAFLSTPNLKSHDNMDVWAFAAAEDNANKLMTRGQWDGSIWVRKANLLHNYDGGTNAELNFTGSIIPNNGGTALNLRGGSTTYWQASDHASTCSLDDTNDNNCYTPLNGGGSSNDSMFWSNKKYFVNFYERDWGSSNKPLGKASHAGKETPFEGRRKFTDEWYLFHPTRTQTQNDAVPMSVMFNNIGVQVFAAGDPDPEPTLNDCNGCCGIKAEFAFTRGWQ